jgi:hypothetical protein
MSKAPKDHDQVLTSDMACRSRGGIGALRDRLRVQQLVLQGGREVELSGARSSGGFRLAVGERARTLPGSRFGILFAL